MELKFKILNKSKDGVVVDFVKRGKVKLTWDRFNEKYVIVDDMYAEFNEVEKERIAKAKEERIAQYKAEAKAARKEQRRKNRNFVYSTGSHSATIADARGFDELKKKFNIK